MTEGILTCLSSADKYGIREITGSSFYSSSYAVIKPLITITWPMLETGCMVFSSGSDPASTGKCKGPMQGPVQFGGEGGITRANALALRAVAASRQRSASRQCRSLMPGLLNAPSLKSVIPYRINIIPSLRTQSKFSHASARPPAPGSCFPDRAPAYPSPCRRTGRAQHASRARRRATISARAGRAWLVRAVVAAAWVPAAARQRTALQAPDC